MKNRNNTGFTIIELMIATTVFGVVLLIVSYGSLQIGRMYTKGITQSSTQGTARAIIDTLSQEIQFNDVEFNNWQPSGAQMATGRYAYCLGNNRYSIAIDTMLVDGIPNAVVHEGRAALRVDKPTSCDPNLPIFTGGRELLGPKMRLARLTITAGDNNLYTINVRVVYGDDDLLNPARDTCRNSRASHFCAVSELTTTVQKRVDL